MHIETLNEARKETLRQLKSYRRNRLRLRMRDLPQPERRLTALWVLAVDAAFAAMGKDGTKRARAVSRMFGLEAPIPRDQTVQERMVLLSIDCNMSISTLYNYREDMVRLTMAAAIEYGALRPFGVGREPDAGMEQLTQAPEDATIPL